MLNSIQKVVVRSSISDIWNVEVFAIFVRVFLLVNLYSNVLILFGLFTQCFLLCN